MRVFKNLEYTKLPFTEEGTRKSPDGLPSLGGQKHLMHFVYGKVGSGKTFLCLQLLHKYLETSTFDKVFYVSPTAFSDTKIQDGLRKYILQDKIVFVEPTKEDFTNEIIDYTYNELEKYRHLLREWKRYQKFLRNPYSDEFTDEEIILWEQKKPVKPIEPNYCVVMDDCVGTLLTGSRTPIMNWLIRNRHSRCSYIILSQVFFNALPRGLRSSLNAISLSKTYNEKMRKDIAVECSFMPQEELLEKWDYATQGEHDFFTIFLEMPEQIRMRRNLSEVL